MTTLYFAYGSNMDGEQMRQRCPEASLAGTAVLPGYMFIINDRGVATIIPKQDASVPGVVWQVSASDESALDGYEGYRLGMYDKCFRAITDGNGGTVNALVYIDHIHTPLGASRDGYLSRIMQAADAHNLPERHVNILRMWPAQRTFRSFNRLVNDVKSGADFSPSIKRHKEDLACALKNARDALFLDTLQQATESYTAEDSDEMLLDTLQQAMKSYTSEDFHKSLEDTVQLWLHDLADQHERNRAAGLSLEHTALIRFMHHVEFLQATDNLVGELCQVEGASEVAGLGVIITSDPARAHEPEDRFIVTAHAPLLGQLWRQLFYHAHGVYPRTCRFMDLFADVADNCKADDEPRFVIERILVGVKHLAAARCSAIFEEFEADHLGNYIR